jgi:hypothetical protein
MKDDPESSSKAIQVSLWAMPPMHVQHGIYADICRFAQHPGVVFQPHVTLVGGFKCDSLQHAKEQAQKVQKALQSNHLQKPLTFDNKVVSKDLWSQSCCIVLNDHDDFDQAVLTCKKALNMELNTDTFYASPIKQPHMSLYYGPRSQAPPISTYEINPFKVDHLELWYTAPVSCEGVRNWYRIAEIPLSN